jgi:heme exporter protein B
MQLLREIGWLFRKELTLEWRQRYAISGILLYVLSTVFIIYISFVQFGTAVWNVLYWVVFLFASVNAIVKSFQQESGVRQLYYYTLANPLAVLLSKMIYNTLLLLLLGLLSYAAFSLIAGNPVQHLGQFLLTLLLGSLGVSITFTFVAAVAAKADQSATLMAILSFPLIIPVLMLLISLSAGALGLTERTDRLTDVLLLVAIDLVLLGMAFLLFPFLWRD